MFVAVKACEEAVKPSAFVPPDRDQVTQLPCGTVGAALPNQCSSAGTQTGVRDSPTPAPVREELGALHGLNCVPVTGQRLRQPIHFRTSAGFRSCDLRWWLLLRRSEHGKNHDR